MDDKDTAILLHLISNPSASNKEISINMDISEATVSRRIKSLQKRNIFQGTQLVVDLFKLGLETYSIILQPGKPWKRSIRSLEYFFETHAYTGYQNRIFGKENGLFIQLTLPFGLEQTVEELLTELKKNGLIKEFAYFLQTYDRLYYQMNIEKYDRGTRLFEINYEKIEQIISENYSPLPLTKSSKMENIDAEFIDLVSQMFQESFRSLESIGKGIGMSKQEVSRKKLDYKLDTWNYETKFDRSQFGIFNQVMYILSLNETHLATLDVVLQEHYPFKATIIPTTKAYILLIHLPAIDVMRFTNILQLVFDNVDLYLLSRYPINYPPWSGNLIDETEWNSSKEKVMKTFTEDYNNTLSISEFLNYLPEEEINSLYKAKYNDTTT